MIQLPSPHPSCSYSEGGPSPDSCPNTLSLFPKKFTSSLNLTSSILLTLDLQVLSWQSFSSCSEFLTHVWKEAASLHPLVHVESQLAHELSCSWIYMDSEVPWQEHLFPDKTLTHQFPLTLTEREEHPPKPVPPALSLSLWFVSPHTAVPQLPHSDSHSHFHQPQLLAFLLPFYLY